ncbi:DUF2333 family protein [bacterium]|jgi:hypothetical protein|nr:DUF2333 family protein [bacterium]
MENKSEKSDWFLVRFYKKNREVIEKYARQYVEWLVSEFSENFIPWLKTNWAFLTLVPFAVILWFSLLAPITAMFTMSEKPDIYNIVQYEGNGNSTIHAMMDPLNHISRDEVLMTNFWGVRFWNDNVYNQQIGQFRMYRQILFTFRDYIGRNRSSNGQNDDLITAHNEISPDSSSVYPVNFDFQVKKTIKALERYQNNLEIDKEKPLHEREAVFIANSDNLAKSIRLWREQLLSSSDPSLPVTFMNGDNDYMELRGDIISLYQFMKGIEPDYKTKMIEKGAYEESYLPLLEMMKVIIERKPFFITEFIQHHVTSLRGNSQALATKMNEFASKLDDG